ncbi:uncharacterized protein LOC144180004 [Haemaphysalis longicornis]
MKEIKQYSEVLTVYEHPENQKNLVNRVRQLPPEVSWTEETYHVVPAFTRKAGDLPDYDTYRAQERGRLQQLQEQQLDETNGVDNTSGRPAPAPNPSLQRHDPRGEVFLNVALYIACACVLMGVVLLFTLVVVCGGKREHPGDSSSFPLGRRRHHHADYIPLLDRKPLLAGSSRQSQYESGDDDEYDELDTALLMQSLREMLSESSEAVMKAHKEAVKRPIAVFPSHLLDVCSQDEPLTFSSFLPNGSRDRSKWIAHGTHCEVFKVVSLLKRTVLKVLPIQTGDFSDNRISTITSAIECHLKLKMLKHGTNYRTPNFIEVQKIACVFDRFPEWLLRHDRSHCASTESLSDDSGPAETASKDSPGQDLLAAFRRWKGTNQCCLTRHFIVFELCFGGKSLSRITLRSAAQGRSLVRQASCCLAVAERALGFRMSSVDPDKLLVMPTDAAAFEYRIRGRPSVSVESAGLKAHLAGCLSFELSKGWGRDLKQEEHSSGPPSPSSVRSEESTAASTPRFNANVTWLDSVVDNILHKLRTEVPEPRASTEHAVFEELEFWHERLSKCNSADEFISHLNL